MAYKNMAANKRHIKKLWDDPNNWRNKVRAKRRKQQKSNESEFDIEAEFHKVFG